MSEDAQVPPAPPSEPPPSEPPSSEPPPASPPAGGSSSGASDNRTLWMILSYLWLFALIPFLAEQDDREVQWHSKHGLVLTGAEIAIYLVLWVISLTGVLACLTCLIYLPLFVGSIVLRVVCITKALNGERVTVPGLSELADRF